MSFRPGLSSLDGYLAPSGNSSGAACGLSWMPDVDKTSNGNALKTWLGFVILVVAASTFGARVRNILRTHQLAGYMLLGFLCTGTDILDMIRFTWSLETLWIITILCKAFIAFETPTHLAHFGELKFYRRSICGTGLLNVVCCFLVGWGAFTGLVGTSLMGVTHSLVDGMDDAPRITGALATVSAIAVGVVMSAAEPSTSAEITSAAHASGFFTASALRSATGTTLFAVLLMLVASPIVANYQYGIEYAAVSCVISILLTLVVGAMLWFVILVVLKMPIKQQLVRNKLPLVRKFAARMDKYAKIFSVLLCAVWLFLLANILDGLPVTPRAKDMVASFVEDGDCVVDFAEPRYAEPDGWSIGFAISFQPWPACFLASFLTCNSAHIKRMPHEAQSGLKWRLLLQPWSRLSLLMLGTISGIWLLPRGVLGGPLLLALVLFFARFAVSWACSLASVAVMKLPKKVKRAAGLDRVIQAQVALCFLWELHMRAPALQVYPFSYTSVAGMLIFLEVLLGTLLFKLGLRVAGETHVDQIGKACVLGCEGAPPFITLKLIQWEVRAGGNSSHVGELIWKVIDTEKTDYVDERSVKQILLNRKPDAFVSMMQDDSLNYDACELLQGIFDMPRCIVQCMDQSWVPKFKALGELGAGAGDVVVVSHLNASMRNMLEQFVQSAQSAIMLLHDDPGADVIKVTITDKEKGLVVRDMKLPEDIQVLTIVRNSTPIVPHGHTKLAANDEVMICGRPNSLASVTAMKKGKVVLLMGR